MKKYMIFLVLAGLLYGMCVCDELAQEPEQVEPVEPAPLVDRDPLLQVAIGMRDEVSQHEVVTLAAGEEKPFLVSRETARIAYEENKTLNESILFYTDFLKNRKRVRDFLQAPKIFDGKYTKTNTSDNEIIHYMHFDRGSDTLLVVGGALLNMEKMASFVKMFTQYDLIIFNHRGIAYDDSSLFNPGTWPYWLSSTCVAQGLRGSKLRLGLEEEKDVFAVIYDIFKKKSYAKIYGLALCYSAPIFIKAAVTRPGVFDKLILDGSWIYMQTMVDRFIEGWRAESKLNWLYNILPNDREWFQNMFTWLAEFVSGVKFRSLDVDFTPYLKELDIPVLFIHSVNDSMVPTSEFEDIWAYVPSTQKAAVLTTYEHIRNHLKRKELYKYLADSFFNNSFENFVKSMQI